MKGNKWIRIICLLLVIIMALGMIIPYVSATEIADATGAVSEPTDTTLDSTETLPNETDAIVGENFNQEDDATLEGKPEGKLPSGFEYVQNGNAWEVHKTDDSIKSAIMIDPVPFGFDANAVNVFIGNVDTKEVTYCTLDKNYSYVSKLNLKDGYYVLFPNGYAWKDSLDNAYAINSGEYQFIYVGDNFDESKYGDKFNQMGADGIFHVSLGYAKNGMTAIAHNTTLVITESNLAYPNDVDVLINTTEHNPTEAPATTGSHVTEPTQEEEKKDRSLFGIFTDAFKKSFSLIVLVVICWGGLTIIKLKKKAAIKKQTENDQYDDKRVE